MISGVQYIVRLKLKQNKIVKKSHTNEKKHRSLAGIYLQFNFKENYVNYCKMQIKSMITQIMCVFELNVLFLKKKNIFFLLESGSTFRLMLPNIQRPIHIPTHKAIQMDIVFIIDICFVFCFYFNFNRITHTHTQNSSENRSTMRIL